MNIIRKWKRFAAVSCSHGHHIDPVARASVLKFMGDFCKGAGAKRIHLGDFVDVEALMGNGAGQGEALAPDIAGGCLLYTSPSPRDLSTSRMPSSA